MFVGLLNSSSLGEGDDCWNVTGAYQMLPMECSCGCHGTRCGCQECVVVFEVDGICRNDLSSAHRSPPCTLSPGMPSCGLGSECVTSAHYICSEISFSGECRRPPSARGATVGSVYFQYQPHCSYHTSVVCTYSLIVHSRISLCLCILASCFHHAFLLSPSFSLSLSLSLCVCVCVCPHRTST